MKSLKDMLAGFNRGPTDLVGLDIGSSGTKAVRMRLTSGVPTVVAAGILPPVAAPTSEATYAPLTLPLRLRARYAAIAASAPGAVIKLLSFPGAFDERAESKLADSMGLDDPKGYRIGYKMLTEGHGRGESRVLAVAWQEAQACLAPQLLPTGIPAPYSLEVSGLATLTAFLHSLPEKERNSPTGLIDFGENTTTYALQNRGVLFLLRRFNFGSNMLLEKVQNSLGVDRETAQGIVSDGSFDISQSLNDVLDPLLKQFMVSRDFVERRENCRITKLYMAGSLARSRDAAEEIHAAMDVELETWNVLPGLTVARDAIPAELQGQEWRLAAAAGACLGAFEEA